MSVKESTGEEICGEKVVARRTAAKMTATEQAATETTLNNLLVFILIFSWLTRLTLRRMIAPCSLP
jgi:hypothetical protein